MHRRSAVGELGQSIPGLILWNLWKLYNRAVYDGVTPTISQIMVMTKMDVLTLSSSFPISRRSPADDILLSAGLVRKFAANRRRIPTLVQWTLPPSGRLKLNVDASYDASGSGGGGILRDDSGNLLLSFAFPINGASSALQAEVAAMALSLRYCMHRLAGPVTIESDSQLLVAFINRHSISPWNLRGFLSEITTSVSLLDCTFHHVYREANAVADSLANIGRSLHSVAFYRSTVALPPRSRFLLASDVRGLPVVRFMNQ